MKRIIGSQNFWTVVAIVILILVVPYSIGWFWHTPTSARELMYDWRVRGTLIALASFVLTRAKIYCREILKIKWLNKKKYEKWVDLPLTGLILAGMGVYFFYLIPAVIVSQMLYNISINKHATNRKKIEIFVTLLVIATTLLLTSNPTIRSIALFIFFITLLETFLYFLINVISSIKKDPLFVDRIIAGLYWVLSIGALNIIGSPRRIHGELPPENEYQAIYKTHGSSLPDYITPNTMDVFTPIKPLAGRNLLKYPIFGWLIQVTCIMIERSSGNTKTFFWWLGNQFLRLILWIVKKIFKSNEKLKKNRIFAWLWNLTAYKKSIKHNYENVQTMIESIKKGFKILLYPNGRDLPSDFLKGITKKHLPLTGEFVDSVVPVVNRGPMHYRVKYDKEYIKEVGWSWILLSACFDDNYIYPVIKKINGQTAEEFTNTVNDFIYQKQKEFGFTI